MQTELQLLDEIETHANRLTELADAPDWRPAAGAATLTSITSQARILAFLLITRGEPWRKAQSRWKVVDHWHGRGPKLITAYERVEDDPRRQAAVVEEQRQMVRLAAGKAQAAVAEHRWALELLERLLLDRTA